MSGVSAMPPCSLVHVSLGNSLAFRAWCRARIPGRGPQGRVPGAARTAPQPSGTSKGHEVHEKKEQSSLPFPLKNKSLK